MTDYSALADYEQYSTDNRTPEDLGYMPEPEVVVPATTNEIRFGFGRPDMPKPEAVAPVSSPFSPDEEF